MRKKGVLDVFIGQGINDDDTRCSCVGIQTGYSEMFIIICSFYSRLISGFVFWCFYYWKYVSFFKLIPNGIQLTRFCFHAGLDNSWHGFLQRYQLDTQLWPGSCTTSSYHMLRRLLVNTSAVLDVIHQPRLRWASDTAERQGVQSPHITLINLLQISLKED